MKVPGIQSMAMEQNRTPFDIFHSRIAGLLRFFVGPYFFAASILFMGMMFSCRSVEVKPGPATEPVLQGSTSVDASESAKGMDASLDVDRRRQAEQAKAEEERRRQAEQVKAEEDRRRQAEQAKAEEERRRQAEQAKAEEERRRQEEENRRLAIAARERSLAERKEFDAALALYMQEEQKKEREERLDREDPDRNSFYRTAIQNRLGRDLTVIVPEKSSLFIFGNPSPLQFQGYGSFRHSYDPRLLSGRPVEPKTEEITDRILKNRGNYILLYFKGDGPTPYTSDLKEMMQDGYDLPGFKLDGKWYYVINIYTDGTDLIRVEAEAKEGGEGIPEYLIWSLDHLRIRRQNR